MKIKSAKTYTYHVYHAAIGDEKGTLHVGNRMTVLSTVPLKVSTQKLEAKLKDANYQSKVGQDPMMLTMFRGAHLDNLITFEHPDGEKATIYVIGDAGPTSSNTMKVDGYNSPVHVLSQHDEWGEYAEMTPVAVIESMTGKKVEGEDIDAKELLETSMDRVKRIAAMDAKFGVEGEAAKAVERITREGEMLIKMAENLPDMGDEGGDDAANSVIRQMLRPKVMRGQLDGDKATYTPAKVTDFADASLIDDDGNTKDAYVLRVAHLDDPTWHQPDDDLKAMGFVGFWQFPTAVLGSRGQRHEDHVEVIYTGYRDLKVAVKKVDSINPVGSMPIPVEVYRAITDGAEPSVTMNSKEAMEYSRSHLAKMYDEPFGGPSN